MLVHFAGRDLEASCIVDCLALNDVGSIEANQLCWFDFVASWGSCSKKIFWPSAICLKRQCCCCCLQRSSKGGRFTLLRIAITQPGDLLLFLFEHVAEPRKA